MKKKYVFLLLGILILYVCIYLLTDYRNTDKVDKSTIETMKKFGMSDEQINDIPSELLTMLAKQNNIKSVLSTNKVQQNGITVGTLLVNYKDEVYATFNTYQLISYFNSAKYLGPFKSEEVWSQWNNENFRRIYSKLQISGTTFWGTPFNETNSLMEGYVEGGIKNYIPNLKNYKGYMLVSVFDGNDDNVIPQYLCTIKRNSKDVIQCFSKSN